MRAIRNKLYIFNASSEFTFINQTELLCLILFLDGKIGIKLGILIYLIGSIKVVKETLTHLWTSEELEITQIRTRNSFIKGNYFSFIFSSMI